MGVSLPHSRQAPHHGARLLSEGEPKEARIKRDDARKLRDNNIDPIIARGSMRQIAASSLTVMQAAEACIAVQEKEFKTKRYGRQIRKRLKTYVQPIIGHLPSPTSGLPKPSRSSFRSGPA